jgi:hypothetical protein
MIPLTASGEYGHVRIAHIASPNMHIGFLPCGIHELPMQEHILARPMALGIFERCACPQIRTLKDFSLIALHI